MVPRRLLLVGEGNFSFAASLIDGLDPDVSVTATGFQHRADLEGDPVALENLRRLRERGVEVRFGVDCTQLADEREFDRIYFNFPHCGRKAGVAKNRELLAKFFQRSQDRPFHIEGALTYIFTQSLPFESSRPRTFRVRLEDRWFYFTEPEALLGKLNRTINEKLIAELGKTFPLKRLRCPLPLLSQGGPSVLPPVACDLLPTFWICLHEDSSCSELLNGEITEDMEEIPDSGSECTLPKSPARDGCKAAQEGVCEQVKLRLRPSLLVHAEPVIHSPEFLPGSLYVLSGPVFRKCHILPFTMPAFHETLFILGFNRNTKESCLLPLLDHLKDTLGNFLTQTLQEDSSLSTSVDFVLQPNGKDYVIHVKSLDFGPDCTENLIIGSIVTSTIVKHKHQCFVFVSINLDLLVMLAYDISDWRILWTFDNRFLKRFAPGKIEHFKSYSLYPPCYVHDVSFWLDEKNTFDELEFHTVARAVSRDTIVSIQFLDRFQHPETQQVSLCYRLTYQTCDKALTPQLAAAMQSQFRKEIQRELHVSPR
ncbi:ferredoxin-fold anticodon-binding domain-containing protein 1 isoform 2 [Rattus norvegicus]|nr:ferredoxin-fold anticodon-binding domain-containing protein 1 isoform 2 [Rattus norvegicus]